MDVMFGFTDVAMEPPATVEIDEMFGFESEQAADLPAIDSIFSMTNDAAGIQEEVQPVMDLLSIPREEDSNLIFSQPLLSEKTSEKINSQSDFVSIRKQLDRLQTEIKQIEQASRFSKVDSNSDKRSEVHKYLDVKTYKDSHDAFKPSRRLQKYYSAREPPAKPKNPIYSPYSKEELAEQRRRVRSELEAQKLKEQEECSYYERQELKMLNLMYSRLESELNSKMQREDFAKMKRQELSQFVSREPATDDSADTRDMIQLEISEHNTICLPRSLFYTSTGEYKVHVHYLDYQKIQTRFSRDQIVLFIFVVSSPERKFKKIAKSCKDFRTLHEQLLKLFNQAELPELPRVASVRMSGDWHEAIAATRDALFHYLNGLNRVQAIRASNIYRNFLRNDDLRFFQGL